MQRQVQIGGAAMHGRAGTAVEREGRRLPEHGLAQLQAVDIDAPDRDRGQAPRQVGQLRQAEWLLRGRFRRWCRCRQPRQRHAARTDIGDGEPRLQQCRWRQLHPGILDLEPGALVVAQP